MLSPALSILDGNSSESYIVNIEQAGFSRLYILQALVSATNVISSGTSSSPLVAIVSDEREREEIESTETFLGPAGIRT